MRRLHVDHKVPGVGERGLARHAVEELGLGLEGDGGGAVFGGIVVVVVVEKGGGGGVATPI